jgi:carbonic anhydrase
MYTKLIGDSDCGLTHYDDADVKKALMEIAPQEKDYIEGLKYGEIKTS